MVSFENSTNMDMVFSIVAAIFIVPWHVVNVHGYSLTNATDSGKIFILSFNLFIVEINSFFFQINVKC